MFEYLEEVVYPTLFPVLTHEGEIDAHLMMRFLQFNEDDMWFTHLDEEDSTYLWMSDGSWLLSDFEPLPRKNEDIINEDLPPVVPELELYNLLDVGPFPVESAELDVHGIRELLYYERFYSTHMDDDLFLYLRVNHLYILTCSELVRMMKRWLRYLHQYQCRPPKFSKS